MKMSKVKRYGLMLLLMVIVFVLGSTVGTYGQDYQVENKQTSIKSLTKEVNSLQKEKDKLAKDNKETIALVKKRDSLEADVKELNSKYKKAETKYDVLKKKIVKKEDLLDSMVTKVIFAKSEPITLSAGQYVIGDDIPADRYRVESVGEGSNFVVESAEGDLKVNTILGSSGNKTYTFFGETGDNLETQSDIKLTPIN